MVAGYVIRRCLGQPWRYYVVTTLVFALAGPESSIRFLHVVTAYGFEPSINRKVTAMHDDRYDMESCVSATHSKRTQVCSLVAPERHQEKQKVTQQRVKYLLVLKSLGPMSHVWGCCI